MAAVWMRLRSEMRAGIRAWVSLALLLGLVAGASTAAAAGARRTASAYPRFLEAQDAFHAMTGGGAEDEYEAHLAAIKANRAVEDWVEMIVMGGAVTIPSRPGRPERRLRIPEVFVIAEPTGRWLYETNRAKLLDGRRPDRASPHETIVPFTFAERNGIRVGDVLRAGTGFDPDTFRPLREIELRVVGITASPGDFEALGQTNFTPIYATPAFVEKYRDLMPPRIPDLLSLAVHLKGGGAAAPSFKKHVEGTLNIDVPLIEPVITDAVQKNMRLYVAALWLLAAFIAVAGLAVFGQALARQLFLESEDYPTLRALGFGRRELISLGLARAAIVGMIAAAIAVAVAFLASPVTPIGAARIAEPHPGFAFDATAIASGALATVICVMLVGLLPAVRAAIMKPLDAPARAGATHPSRVVVVASRASMSPPAVAGLRMALESGRGRTAVPVRTTISAVAVALAAVTATVLVGRSLDHLIETPALTGFTYDAIAPGDDRVGGTNAQRNAKLRSFDFVEAASEGTGVQIDIGNVDSFLIGFQSGGAIGFAVISGRTPADALHRGVPEVAVGPATMRRMKLALGDTVSIGFTVHDEAHEKEARSAKALVVGVAAIPPLPWAATAPGEGVVMTTASIEKLALGDQGGCCFVRFKKGTDLERARATLEQAGFEISMRTKRADLVTLERITGLPAALSAIFGALALSALAHVLLTAIHRRRRDLAILKTLGFVRRDLRRTVAWQSSAVVVVSVVLGIPAGIVLGRWGWRAVADQFGVVPVPVVPAILAAVLPVALVVANLVAVGPARSAVRTKPAVILRED